MPVEIGVHDIAMATTTYRMDVDQLARATGEDVDKYRKGIGQDSQSVPAADEDIVTMAAEAGLAIMDRHGSDDIHTVVVATETGIDQSKSAGLYVHSLLGLPANVRVVELKQACYGGTAALQFVAGLLTRHGGKALVIAADIARYDIGSSGESTQGAAAVAMLVVADAPAIAVIEPAVGLHSADIMDFWRPNHRSTARVDGRASVSAYLEACTSAYGDYARNGGLGIDEFSAFCYHQPFTKMAHKAHRHLLNATSMTICQEQFEQRINLSTLYNRTLGNSYTASLYVALSSLLDHGDGLAGGTIGMFSYGSGCVAEFFALKVQSNHEDHLRRARTRELIDSRVPIDYQQYLAQRQYSDVGGGDREFPELTRGPFRLAAIRDEKRVYEAATI